MAAAAGVELDVVAGAVVAGAVVAAAVLAVLAYP